MINLESQTWSSNGRIVRHNHPPRLKPCRFLILVREAYIFSHCKFLTKEAIILTGKGQTFWLTLTNIPGGKQSSCSLVVSRRQNLSWTCVKYSIRVPGRMSLEEPIASACAGVKWNRNVPSC